MNPNSVEYDISNLSEKIAGLQGALLGRGASRGDLQTVARLQFGQLHAAIGDAIGPKEKDTAEKRITRDIKKQLTTAPEYINSAWTPEKSESSHAEFTWLTAGKGFVLGINDEDLQLKASGAEALAMLRSGQKKGARGDAYIKLGKRGNGNVNVMRLNRIKVSKTTFNAVRRTLFTRSGELRAVFYRAARQYAPRIRVPAWIAKKFDQVAANGKSDFHDTFTGGNDFGYIESITRAPGVTNNPALASKIQGAIRSRTEIVFAAYQKVISGYKYKFATGQTFKSAAIEEGVI
jgi:hypothetical protein